MIHCVDRKFATLGAGKKRICGCCVTVRTGVSVMLWIKVRDRVGNRVRGKAKLAIDVGQSLT